MDTTVGLDARIAIVGAGPAGLSAAWFLKAKGYRNVTVLEKTGRVGGLCLSITENYDAYDIGANYVTMEYVETRKIARQVGAKLYFEDPYTALYVPPDGKRPQYQSFLEAMRIDAATGKKVPVLRYIGLTLKYLWLRLKLGRVIDPPTFAHVIDEAPELGVSFADWLAANELEPLTRLFEIPVTIMGYGQLSDIPAPYVLKYIGPRTFVPMLFFGVPVLRYLLPWPKRFVQGFQRMWERVSWELNVRFNVDILAIERRDDGVRIRFTQREQVLDTTRVDPGEMDFDYVMLACPLCPPVTERFMTLSEAERALFSKIDTHTYTMYTATVRGLDMPTPIAVTFPLTEMGTPWGVTQQWMSRGSYVTQFYVQLPGERCTAKPSENYREEVRRACDLLVRRMGARIESDLDAWKTFDAFPYFQHVDVPVFAGGWYKRLEAQQGVQRTFYLGGATNFELVEPIVRYSRHIVDTHFPAA